MKVPVQFGELCFTHKFIEVKTLVAPVILKNNAPPNVELPACNLIGFKLLLE